MKKKIYCGNCKHGDIIYFPYGDKIDREYCNVLENWEKDFAGNYSIQKRKPSEINKNMDCKWYDEKKKSIIVRFIHYIRRI